MILLLEKIGQGPTRRCDARCYSAKSGDCKCICGGRNHGAGIERALDNVRDMFLGEKHGEVTVTRRAERALRRREEQPELSA